MWIIIARIARRQLFSSPTTVALTVSGVGVGVAVFIFTVAMMDGLVAYFEQRILRVAPTLTVLPEREDTVQRATRPSRGQKTVVLLTNPASPDERPTIRGGIAYIPVLEKLAGVEGVAPAVNSAAVLAFGTVSESVTIFGVDPRRERSVTELYRLVVEGSWDELDRKNNGVIVGFKLAERLGVGVGDRVTATGEAGGTKDLEVVGILAVGLGNWDEGTAIVGYPVAQGLAGWNADEVSELRLRTSLQNLEVIRQAVRSVTERRVERWEEVNRPALQLFRTIGLTTYLLTGFVLLVAGFGISNKLATVILNRERDIAILRAYGFSRGAVRSLFLAQGLLLGLLGAVLGCLFAFLGISYFQVHPIRFSRQEKAVLAYTELYLANEPSYYVFVATAAVIIAGVASLLSVRRAAKVLPVEVLREQT